MTKEIKRLRLFICSSPLIYIILFSLSHFYFSFFFSVGVIAKFVGKELKYEMIDFHSTLLGHDLRYGLDGNKLKEIGWAPRFKFEDSLEKTVKWTLNNLE